MMFECRDCGARLPELRRCELCDVEACAECMLRHLKAAHPDEIVLRLSFAVDAASVEADKADLEVHKRMGV